MTDEIFPLIFLFHTFLLTFKHTPAVFSLRTVRNSLSETSSDEKCFIDVRQTDRARRGRSPVPYSADKTKGIFDEVPLKCLFQQSL